MLEKLLAIGILGLISLLYPHQNDAGGEQQQDLKGVHVLVYTKNGKGYVHQNIGAAGTCIMRLGKEMGFTVDTTHDPAAFSEDNLKKYRLIVFNNTNNDVFENDVQKLALMHFVEAGGGVVGLHSASGTERNWPWFKRMLGGSFMRHPPHQPFTEIVLDPHHPSTSFLSKTWARKDECYFIKEINPDIHVLMVHDLRTLSDSAKSDLFGIAFPSVWCHEFDGGRQWYTSLGHDSATYSEPDFVKHIRGGIEWVLQNNRPLDYKKAHALSPADPLPY